MLPYKSYLREKKNQSGKKIHRRVITELDEAPSIKFYKPEYKKSEKVASKPKFIDVLSKYNGKEHPRKNNFKIYHPKSNLQADKVLKTEGDESLKQNTITSHQYKSKILKEGNRYEIQGTAGKGTFGVVFMGVDKVTGEKIAMKKVFQDKKYKNRELQILKMMDHPNILRMKDSFITHEGEDEYLNIVMGYYSDNLYQVIKKKEMSPDIIKIAIYQVLRGLNYLSMLSIAHRDIKPQNILYDKHTKNVIICDFGSAKKLVRSKYGNIQPRPI